VGTCAELASCIRRDAWHLKPDCPRIVHVPGSRISGNPHVVGRALQPQLDDQARQAWLARSSRARAVLSLLLTGYTQEGDVGSRGGQRISGQP